MDKYIKKLTYLTLWVNTLVIKTPSVSAIAIALYVNFLALVTALSL